MYYEVHMFGYILTKTTLGVIELRSHMIRVI